eukprot:gnl/Hemi2/6938_TR2367_c0_g1_i1.p1 gnl/Hemi2/6938_TR2367_c0_g1~~gnl/Hemi2/6938_TR2367_c0_g1_i1.p1  ORF type:complete len:445 (+),score=156.54 gnl/Hemi2/6938_TR2367_c0_g1_i1:59-1336(+)
MTESAPPAAVAPAPPAVAAPELTGRALVDDRLKRLCAIRDTFHTKETAEKQGRISAEIAALMPLIDALPQGNTAAEKAEILLLRGRALECNLDHSKEAEDCLARAAKLNPSVPVFNCLAQCFWKRRDLAGARNCLMDALHLARNRESLCQLSLLLRLIARQPGTSQEIIKSSMEEGIALTKEAIRLDLNDGYSWYYYGNALLNYYFEISRDHADFDKAIKAYNTAEKSDDLSFLPDLFYNRATMYKFRQAYQPALADFTRAGSLDPSLLVEPEISEIIGWVVRATQAIEGRGNIKPRKLKTFVNSIPSEKPRDLFSSLANGNNNKRVLCKVLTTLTKPGVTPYLCVAVDRNYDFRVLAVYNLGEGSIKDNDLVDIKEPHVAGVALHESGKTWSYTCLSVLSPVQLKVNRRKLTASNPSTIKVENR